VFLSFQRTHHRSQAEGNMQAKWRQTALVENKHGQHRTEHQHGWSAIMKSAVSKAQKHVLIAVPLQPLYPDGSSLHEALKPLGAKTQDN